MDKQMIAPSLFKFTPEQNEFLHQITLESDKKLSDYATKDCEALRNHDSKYNGEHIRTSFGIDIDLILHNPFYN